MKFAVVLNENPLFVDNIIVANEEQKEELETALNAQLLDASLLDMEIGDYYNGNSWTRNIDGEQIALPIGDNPSVTAAIDILGGVTNVDE